MWCKAAFPKEVSWFWMYRETLYPLRNRNPWGLRPLNCHRTRLVNDVHPRRRSTSGFRLCNQLHQHSSSYPIHKTRTHHDREFSHWGFNTWSTDWGSRTVAWYTRPKVSWAFRERTRASEHSYMRCGVVGGFGGPGETKLKDQAL